jgi:hypothetical protein
MSTIPKIVLARLKADSAAAKAKHPDADVLTAFAEQALTVRERAGVFEHLALCADCREVVAMALPPAEDMATIMVEDRSSRFVWPLLRWGFATVGVLLIGWFGVRLLQQSHSSNTVATFSEPRNSIAAKRESLAPPASAPADKTEKAEKSTTAARPSELVASEPTTAMLAKTTPEADTASTDSNRQHPATAGGAAGSRLSGGPLASMQQQQRQQVTASGAAGVAAAKPVPSAVPPGMVSETVTVEAASPQIGAQAGMQKVDAQHADAEDQVASLRDQPSPAQSQDEDSTVQLSRAKPPQSPSASASSQPVSGGRLKAQAAPAANIPLDGRNVSELAATTSVASAKWNISAGGGLQRSFDQGGTWQDVNVLAETIPPNQFASYDALSQSAVTDEISRIKEKDAENEKKTAKGKSSPFTFRAVTANGADVWAAGSRGILYHSSDGGNHWTRIIPFAGGTALTGDIVAVEFPDPQHGRLTTSFAEVWTTSNAGQSWQKQ